MPQRLLLLAARRSGSVLVSSAGEWHPAALVAVLGVLALVGECFSVELSDGALTASTVAIVLAMALLGPTPAAACGVVAMTINALKRRPSGTGWLNNIVSFAAVPFVGGFLMQRIGGGIPRPSQRPGRRRRNLRADRALRVRPHARRELRPRRRARARRGRTSAHAPAARIRASASRRARRGRAGDDSGRRLRRSTGCHCSSPRSSCCSSSSA